MDFIVVAETGPPGKRALRQNRCMRQGRGGAAEKIGKPMETWGRKATGAKAQISTGAADCLE